MLTVVIDLACLNDLKLVSAIFSLKAASPLMATTWIEAIQQAQVTIIETKSVVVLVNFYPCIKRKSLILC